MLSHGSCNSRGFAILLKRGVDISIQSKVLDPLGRFIILKAEIADATYVLINIYAPNKDKEIVKFFQDLTTVLKKRKPGYRRKYYRGWRPQLSNQPNY